MKSNELVRMLRKDGWYIVRQSGSHMTMRHDSKPGQLVVPDHGSNEVGKGLKNKIKRDAGLK